MGAIGDFLGYFKGGLTPGETAAGNWRYLEKYGRFAGKGEIEADVDLPKGKAVFSIEEVREVDAFEIELTAPGGGRVTLKRAEPSDDYSEMGTHNLFRLAEAEIGVDVGANGPHLLRVRGPDPEQSLLVVAGAELTATDVIFKRF